MALLDIWPFTHELLRQHIRVGDTVMDGTAGNGYDTAFLAQCVGESGRVVAFDIQSAAIEATQNRLLQLGLADRVQLIQDGHQYAAQYISQPLSAAVFNFGYLPRGDKSITTQAKTSVAAVQAALDALQAQGIVCAVLYHGHAAGKPEMQALLDYASSLPHNRFRVLRYEFINKQNCPPILLAIEKLV